MRHPAEIIEWGQVQLGDDSSDADVVETVKQVRTELDEYFSHRPSPTMPSPLERDPQKGRTEIERMVCGVLLGVMTRVAVFEAIENTVQANVVALDRPVDYTTTYVDPYGTHDGEHQFMESMVRALDDGLLRFYRQPRASILRQALRDACAQLPDPAPDDVDFDPWTIEPDELFRLDQVDVVDRVRRTLRHNAETAMLFVRIFPASVLTGYERAGTDPLACTVADLQSMFRDAIPVLRISASLRQKQGISPDPQARHLHPMSPNELHVTVNRDHIVGIRWTDPKLSRPRNGGRCPANSPLPALSTQERRMFDLLGVLDEMCTAEALLHLACLHAPAMWQHQYEANLLCIDVEDHLAARELRARSNMHPKRASGSVS